MSQYPSGISFPFRVSSAGGIRTSAGANKVSDNLRALAKTALMERVIRKAIGTVGYQQVLRSGITASSDIIENLVFDAITQFEPRAAGITVELIEKIEAGELQVILQVGYFFKNTGDPVNMEIQVA